MSIIGILLAMVIAVLIDREPSVETLVLSATFYITLGGIIVAYYAWLVSLRSLLGKGAIDKEDLPRDGLLSRVSVVVPVHNEGAIVSRTLEALVEQDYPKEFYEVVVVDDASADATSSTISEYAKKHPSIIRVMRHDINKGKLAAITTGVSVSKGEVVVILDADTIPEPHAVRRLVSRLSSEEDLVAVSGNIMLEGTESFLTRMQRIEYIISLGIGRFVDQWYNRVNPLVSGALSAFRKNFIYHTLVERKYTIENPFMTVAEDLELTLHAWLQGFRTGYEHRAVAYTKPPSNLKWLYSQRIRWYSSGLEAVFRYFVRRWGYFKKGYKALIARILFLEYFLPIMTFFSYIFLILAMFFSYLGINIFNAPALEYTSVFIAAYVSSVLLGSLTVYYALRIDGTYTSFSMMVLDVLLFVLFYNLLQIIVKVDATIRTIFRAKVKW
ncbi:MAG: glycosyltransferase [Caldisphaeraceae archaeon]|nr:glycosyltransferase [Caldisphaeraceae archaeon]